MQRYKHIATLSLFQWQLYTWARIFSFSSSNIQSYNTPGYFHVPKLRRKIQSDIISQELSFYGANSCLSVSLIIISQQSIFIYPFYPCKFHNWYHHLIQLSSILIGNRALYCVSSSIKYSLLQVYGILYAYSYLYIFPVILYFCAVAV